MNTKYNTTDNIHTGFKFKQEPRGKRKQITWNYQFANMYANESGHTLRRDMDIVKFGRVA